MLKFLLRKKATKTISVPRPPILLVCGVCGHLQIKNDYSKYDYCEMCYDILYVYEVVDGCYDVYNISKFFDFYMKTSFIKDYDC